MVDQLVEGARVTLELKSGRTVRGTVFAVDRESGVVFVESDAVGVAAPAAAAAAAAGGGGAGGRAESGGEVRDVTVVNLSRVVSAAVEAAAPAALEPLPALTVDLAMAREKAAFRKCETRLLTGAPISQRGLDIFDALSRTMPCQWRGDVIEETANHVLVRPPYRPQDVSGNEQRAVQRVRDMIGKIAERLNGAAAPAPAASGSAAPAAAAAAPAARSQPQPHP